MNPINAPTRLQQAAKFRGDILDLGANTTVQCDTIAADNDLTVTDSSTITGALAVGGATVLSGTTHLVGDVTADAVVALYDVRYRAMASVAAAGTVQGDATTIDEPAMRATGANGAAGVILPSAAVGIKRFIYNDSASALKVYPFTSDTIAGGSANAAVVMGGRTAAEFIASGTTDWAMRGVNAATTFTQTYSTADATIAAPTAVTGTSTAGANGYSSAGEAAAIQTAVNALVADDLDNRKAITSIIDALQAAGIVL